MRTERRDFLGLGFDPLPAGEVLGRLAATTHDTPYGYVVTPNVDHIVRLHERREAQPELKALYQRADLCLCDSKVLHLLARARGVRLPVVPGSELMGLVLDRLVKPGDRIAIVGGDTDVLPILQSKYPHVDFVQHRPPMGLRENAAARSAAAEFIAFSHARFTFIAVGSPQQEMIANEARSVARATGMALCIGAGLDFLTGREKRAPKLARALCLEWAHRLVSNPRRMWRRYLVEGPRIFLLTYRWTGSPQDRAVAK